MLSNFRYLSFTLQFYLFRWSMSSTSIIRITCIFSRNVSRSSPMSDESPSSFLFWPQTFRGRLFPEFGSYCCALTFFSKSRYFWRIFLFLLITECIPSVLWRILVVPDSLLDSSWNVSRFYLAEHSTPFIVCLPFILIPLITFISCCFEVDERAKTCRSLRFCSPYRISAICLSYSEIMDNPDAIDGCTNSNYVGFTARLGVGLGSGRSKLFHSGKWRTRM